MSFDMDESDLLLDDEISSKDFSPIARKRLQDAIKIIRELRAELVDARVIILRLSHWFTMQEIEGCDAQTAALIEAWCKRFHGDKSK